MQDVKIWSKFDPLTESMTFYIGTDESYASVTKKRWQSVTEKEVVQVMLQTLVDCWATHECVPPERTL